jgi:hypothetical protein
MSNTLTITSSLINDHWEITGSMSTGSIPAEVFIYENSGTNVLGNFSGVCSVDELTRLQIFAGVVIPIFANKYVRASTIKIVVSLTDPINTPTFIIGNIVADVTALSKAYSTATTVTQVFTI